MKKLLQAKTFIIPAMRAGLCEYAEERVLVKNETLAAMAKTSFGIPLILPEHVELEELKANLDLYLCGRVADMHYDEAQDLWMAHCVADTEEALALFEKGWGVSTSYQVDQKGTGGTLNGVEYNSEILAGTYLHLAIVEHPRYEMAKNPTFYNSVNLTLKTASSSIESNTSKKGASSMLKFWKTKREEVKENSSDLEIEIDGKPVSFDALVSAYKQVLNNKKNEDEVSEKEKEEIKNKTKKNEDKEKEDKEVEEKMNAEVDALLKSFDKDEKENEDDKEEDEEKDNEGDEDADDKKKEDKKNEDKEGKEDKVDEKKNARFEALKNSREIAVANNELEGFKTLQDRAELGRKRYGNK